MSLKPPSRAPIRVERKGFRRHFHPTMAELEAAVRFAESEAKHWRWANIEALSDFIGSSVREQLGGVGVRVDIDGEHIEQGDPLISVTTSKIGPAYATIAMSHIGERPATEFEAGARAIAEKVASLAHTVKSETTGAVKEMAEGPLVERQRQVVAQSAVRTAKTVLSGRSTLPEHAPKPAEVKPRRPTPFDKRT